MDDREKTIRLIEEEISVCASLNQSYRTIDLPALRDILALLKEHEIVPVKEDRINKCECGETVCRYWHPKFCGYCGKELMWY